MRVDTKRVRRFALCLPLLVAWQVADAQRTLVDNFSGSSIDFDAWSSTANLREIIGGRLELKASSPAGVGSRTRLRSRSSVLSSLEGTVTVENATIETGSWSMVRLEGIYYNALSSSPPDYTGDVWAAIFVGERGNGLEAWWEIWESLNSEFTDDVMRDGGTLALPGVLTAGTAYLARIDYDGNNLFTFTVGANNAVGTGPTRMGGPSDGYQEFSVRVYSGGGSIHATLDDTNTDGVMTDDFSTAMIDETKWFHLETARIAENDALRLEVRGVDLQPMSSSQVVESLTLDDNPDYVEAQVTVSADSALDPGLLGQAGIVGVFYNHERDGGGIALPYDGMNGDAFGRVRLELRDGTLVGSAQLEHATDADHSTSDELFQQDFTTSLQVGEDYLLWIMRDGNTMSFGIDDETIDYLITTATYDPSPSSDGGNRTVVSGIQGSGTSDPSGADGFFRASVDNVYVGGPEASTGSSSWLTATHPLVVLQLIAIVLLRSINRSITHRVSS